MGGDSCLAGPTAQGRHTGSWKTNPASVASRMTTPKDRERAAQCRQMFVMLYSIDAIVGPYRAAELVNEYRRRLLQEDGLPDRAALAVACTAYAFSDVYVLAAAGQVWESYAPHDRDEKERISIVEKLHDDTSGHCVKVLTACGIIDFIPLDRLAKEYFLFSWPEEQQAG